MSSIKNNLQKNYNKIKLYLIISFNKLKPAILFKKKKWKMNLNIIRNKL